MPSEHQQHPTTTTQRRPTTTTTPPPEPEHLPCPRCDSTNTKFCYYNNYNFSQPRHFCKACRRYWTHGGTLRDIPVGGGSRKNAKRSRLTTTSTLEFRHMAPPTTTPFLFPFAGDQLLAAGKPPASIESFTSLLNGNCNNNNNNNNSSNSVNNNNQGCGLFGVGIGGFEEGGWGFGRGVWGFTGVGDGGYVAGGGGGGNGWQVESGEVAGECFSLPDLAISTPGMI